MGLDTFIILAVFSAILVTLMLATGHHQDAIVNSDPEVSAKLRQYKKSQITCLLRVNLFPYCFFFVFCLFAPGYLIFRFIYCFPLFHLFVMLQAILTLFLIWGLISRNSLFTPKNLLHWFFTSIFVILISIIGVIPPSFIFSENPCTTPDELQRIGVLGVEPGGGPMFASSDLMFTSQSNVPKPKPKETFIACLIKAQKDATVRLIWCVRILCLMLLLANVVLCGIRFTRTNKLIQNLYKHS